MGYTKNKLEWKKIECLENDIKSATLELFGACITGEILIKINIYLCS